MPHLFTHTHVHTLDEKEIRFGRAMYILVGILAL